MGIKNSRRRSHDIDAVQPDEPDIWEEGKFTPDPDCDRSPVRYRTVTGPDGLPTNARTIYVDWRKSGHIHRFFQCIQVNFDEETIDDSLEIIEDDDSVPDESKGCADMWQAAEIDCSHNICHIHPNGHHPPSGLPVDKQFIHRLDSLKDVRYACAVSSVLINTIAINAMKTCGGEWDERTITGIAEGAVQTLRRAESIRNSH
ncbi:hypothetical protein [Bifidobacterium breve]|uniref:hypothetical protein n=1 Tax=Bifidobacterium breve TaxID=1685 RepID=UPI00374E8448